MAKYSEDTLHRAAAYADALGHERKFSGTITVNSAGFLLRVRDLSTGSNSETTITWSLFDEGEENVLERAFDDLIDGIT